MLRDQTAVKRVFFNPFLFYFFMIFGLFVFAGHFAWLCVAEPSKVKHKHEKKMDSGYIYTAHE